MQNLTKERKQPPVVILQQATSYNIFILCLWLRSKDPFKVPVKHICIWNLQLRMMECFANIVNAKSSIIDVWQGPKYTV